MVPSDPDLRFGIHKLLLMERQQLEVDEADLKTGAGAISDLVKMYFPTTHSPSSEAQSSQFISEPNTAMASQYADEISEAITSGFSSPLNLHHLADSLSAAQGSLALLIKQCDPKNVDMDREGRKTVERSLNYLDSRLKERERWTRDKIRESKIETGSAFASIGSGLSGLIAYGRTLTERPSESIRSRIHEVRSDV